MEKDYYDILSVPRDCSQADIKKAFRKQALKYHPDRNKNNPSAEQKFKEAAGAYEILGDPKKRAQYDQFGHAGVNSRFGQAGFDDIQDIFSSFKDIFEGGDFFGSGLGSLFGQRGFSAESRAPSRGGDLRYRVEVSLLEVMDGVDKTLSYEVERNCGDCKGTGARPGTNRKQCTECKGSGKLVRRQGFFAFSSTCPTCQGEGTLIESPCGVCFGAGRRRKKEKLEVHIPPGVDTGTHLRLSQKGESGLRGGPPGDLYVQIFIRESDKIKRRGSNLIGAVKVSYLQAILGAKVKVDSLRGKKHITIPKGTGHGDCVILKGEGLPGLNGRQKGDLLYQVAVEMPARLKKKEEEMLKQIAELKGEPVLK